MSTRANLPEDSCHEMRPSIEEPPPSMARSKALCSEVFELLVQPNKRDEEMARLWSELCEKASCEKVRSEMAVAMFWLTFVEKSEALFDVFDEADPSVHRVFSRLLPSFREQFLETAMQAGKGERAKGALGQLPPGLAALHELCLPLDKHLEPVSTSQDKDARRAFESFVFLPPEVQKFFVWAEENLSLSHADKRVAATEAVVKWCWYVKTIGEASLELSEAKDRAKRAKYDKARADTDKSSFQRFVESNFPRYHEIMTDRAALQAKRAAERSGDGASEATAEHGAAETRGSEIAAAGAEKKAEEQGVSSS